MSIYRDTNDSISFVHPIGTNLTATVYNHGDRSTPVQAAQQITPVTASGTSTYTLPISYVAVQYDGKLDVVWTDGASFSRTQTVSVVTPLVSPSKLRTLYGSQNVPDGDLADLENSVRVIIESYCNQTFGFSFGAQQYIGTGSGKFELRQRINSLTGVLGGIGFYTSDETLTTTDSNGNPVTQTNLNGELNLDKVGIIQDGWSLLVNWPTYLSIKDAPPEELVVFDPAPDGTIRVPHRYWETQDRGTHYTITAEWGYDFVPEHVQEAAILLANDFITNEVSYRDRYLEVVKNQQDQIEYNAGAYRGTGNVRADLLLSEFRRGLWMLVI